ncbi:MAG TPA: hypothetical protein VHA53_12975 [Nitrolancea sp.]|nr:hypothetical protein [Nitrolancea sp.]
MACLIEKTSSPQQDAFGSLTPAGLSSVEDVEGTCVMPDTIATFTLGIPGSITGAKAMPAVVPHGPIPSRLPRR